MKKKLKLKSRIKKVTPVLHRKWYGKNGAIERETISEFKQRRMFGTFRRKQPVQRGGSFPGKDNYLLKGKETHESKRIKA